MTLTIFSLCLSYCLRFQFSYPSWGILLGGLGIYTVSRIQILNSVERLGCNEGAKYECSKAIETGLSLVALRDREVWLIIVRRGQPTPS